MASRYWVGGAGTWDNASTAHWSATSGGASGASVPAYGADSVFFDANSGGGAVAITGNGAYYFNSTGFTGSFNGTLNVNGTTTLGATATHSSLAIVFIQVDPTSTINTNKELFNSLDVRPLNPGLTSLTIDGDLFIAGALTFGAGDHPITLRLDRSGSNSVGSVVCNAPSSGAYGLTSDAAGIPASLSDASGTNTLAYLTVQDIAFSGGATWQAGTGFVDGGNNTGLTFPATAVVSALFFGAVA